MKKLKTPEVRQIEERMRRLAEILVESFNADPFASWTTTQRADKLRKITTAIDALTKELDSLVPKGLGSLDEYPFNSHLAMQIDHAHHVKGILSREPHWSGHVEVKFGSDYRRAPVGLVLTEIMRLRDAVDQALAWTVPKGGRPENGTFNDRLRHAIARNLVATCQSALCAFPPITKNGWAVTLLQEIFEKHCLGDGAEHYLRKAIKVSIDAGVTREVLEMEARSRVSK